MNLDHAVLEDALSDTSRNHIDRLPFLDALRGIAAAAVVFFHLIYIPKLPVPWWGEPFRLGGRGVTLFFIVSAFSLMHTAGIHRDARPILAFYVRRFFRIAPLFYFMLAIISLFVWFRYGATYPLLKYIESIFFVFNFVPGEQEGIVWASWTIGVEMLFYALFPFAFRFANSLPRALLVFVISACLSVATRDIVGPGYFHLSILRHLSIFFIGMVAFHTVGALKDLERRREIGFALIASSLLIFFAFANSNPEPVWYYGEGFVIAAFLVGLYLSPTAIFVNRFTTFLGRISFSLYLLHPLIILTMQGIFAKLYHKLGSVEWSYAACCAIVFAVLIPLSTITFYLIEQPGINLGKRILSALRLKQAPLVT